MQEDMAMPKISRGERIMTYLACKHRHVKTRCFLSNNINKNKVSKTAYVFLGSQTAHIFKLCIIPFSIN